MLTSLFGFRTPVKEKSASTTATGADKKTVQSGDMANMEINGGVDKEKAGDEKKIEERKIKEEKNVVADANQTPVKQFDDVFEHLEYLENQEKKLKEEEEELDQLLKTRLEEQLASKQLHNSLVDEKRIIQAEIYRLKTKDAQLDNVLEPEAEVDGLLASTNELLSNAMNKITETVNTTKKAYAKRKGALANTDADVQCDLEVNDMTIIRSLVNCRYKEYVQCIENLAHEKYPVTKRGWAHVLKEEKVERAKLDELTDTVVDQRKILNDMKPVVPESPVVDEEIRSKRKRSPTPDSGDTKQLKLDNGNDIAPAAEAIETNVTTNGDSAGDDRADKSDEDTMDEPTVIGKHLDESESVACKGCTDRFPLDVDGNLSRNFKAHCVACSSYKNLNLLKQCEFCSEVLMDKAAWSQHVDDSHTKRSVKPRWMSRGTYFEIVSQPEFRDITRCKGCGRRFNYNIPTDGTKKITSIDHYTHCITDCKAYEDKGYIEQCDKCKKKFMLGDLAEHESCDEQTE